MTAGRKAIQWAVRVVLLLAALVLAMGSPVPDVLVRVFPGLSPLVAGTSSIAQRRWYLGLYWLGPPLVVLLLALWKGRLFCRWICPAGTLYSIGSRVSLRKRLLKVRLNGYLFWTTLSAAVVGVPLLAFLDPLSTFNRATPLLRGTYTAASLVPGVILPLVLLLGVVQPMIWCTHLCPLGYLFELCHSARRSPGKAFSRSRRQIVTGLLVGAPLAAVARGVLLSKDTYGRRPVLPPGAEDLETFAANCTRCYACVDVCPTKVIRVGAHADRALLQLFQPEIEYFDSEDQPDCGYCAEPCNLCTQVCPAGALTPLTLEEKNRRQIGVAKIIRTACLAWEDGEACAVCQEVCPYLAIDLEDSEAGVPCPVVNEDACRGCGACYSKCPAIRAGKAIEIVGVERQGPAIDVVRRRRRGESLADAGLPSPPPPV